MIYEIIFSPDFSDVGAGHIESVRAQTQKQRKGRSRAELFSLFKGYTLDKWSEKHVVYYIKSAK